MAGSNPIEVLPTATAVPSGTQMASTALAMSGHGSGAGLGRTSSASQSGMIAARITAARVLMRARLRTPHTSSSSIFSPNGPCYQLPPPGRGSVTVAE